MNGQDETNIPTTDREPRWDADLLGKRFQITEERPHISPGARLLDFKENEKRHRTVSSDKSWWARRNLKNKA